MQNRLTRLLLLCSIIYGVSFSGSAVRAQEAKEKPSSEAAAFVAAPVVYRLEYVVREIERGKPVNMRNYVLMARSGRGTFNGDRASFRVGSRVPILMASTPKPEGASAQVTYEDVGMNIDCWVKEGDQGLSVHTNLEMKSVADSKMSSVPSTPVIRRFHIEDDTLVTPGKPGIVGYIDDVTTDRRYEVEVIATKVK
jgi:hypothetical protein